VDVVTTFAEGLNMQKYVERRHYQSARVKLTKCLLRHIRDIGLIHKDAGIPIYGVRC
jgi:hypothetical protein